MNSLIIAQKVSNYPGVLIPDRPIAFNRDFVRLGIGVKGALFLSQAIYWSKRTKDPEGWFYKTNPEWEEETGLTEEEQRTVRKIIQKKEFIKVEKRGIPAKNYYLVDLDNIAASLVELTIPQQQDVGNPDHWLSGTPTTGSGEPRQHSITESTTESTHNSAGAEKSEIESHKEVTDGEGNPLPQKRAKGVKASNQLLEVFALFKNPAGKAWGVMPAQRNAAKILLETYGFARVKKFYEASQRFKDDPFAPKVDSPYDLLNKLAKLKDYEERRN